jgi:hypothetical protein
MPNRISFNPNKTKNEIDSIKVNRERWITIISIKEIYGLI